MTIVSEGNDDPLRLGEKFGPQAMSRRIQKMMEFLGKLLKIYVKLQFETSGMAFGQIASQMGISGGSEEPWEPLRPSTEWARHRKYGYYSGLPGSGDLPRVWSGRGLIVAQQAVQVSANAVEINIRDAILSLNEPTRPLFVLTEVARLAKAAAEKFFKALTGDKVHVYAEDTFNLRVGEAQPFVDDGPRRGRPPLSGWQKLSNDVFGGI